MVLRSLRCLRNAAGHVTILDKLSVESDVLVFDAGNKFLKFLMRWMKEDYRADHRSGIGPIALAKVFKLFCKLSEDRQYFSYKSDDLFICHDETPFTLMRPSAFHPIGYFDQNKFYSCDYSHHEAELEIFKSDSYSVHVYGSGHGAHVPNSSLFAFLAQRFCPSVYGEIFCSSDGTYKF